LGRIERRGGARRLKVAPDTNVLVSAVIADGPPRRLLEAVSDRRVSLILLEPAQVELRRVLLVKIHLAEPAADALLALVEELAHAVVGVPPDVAQRSGDPADDRIIAAAVAGGAEVLVSADTKHVLPLRRVGAMRILRPQDLLAELAG
jgi:putative PIN family toxin of toxin-antitoxin system